MLICLSLSYSEYGGFRHVKLIHNNEEILIVQGCSPLIYNLNSSDETEGPYQCVGTLQNGTLVRTPAGNLHVIGES